VRGRRSIQQLVRAYGGLEALPGTIRDSIFILDGLLEQETNLRPTEVMTDTASYSDLVFGLFRVLGYQFSPRIADIGDARFWRIDRDADYGPLDALARNRINLDLVVENWDDILRVAGSLMVGRVAASDLIRSLQAGGRPTALGRAIAEIGRVPKTVHLLAYSDDESYRRRILVRLSRHESRHSLARAVFHGQRGELRQHYREGQEEQLGALGLVVNAIVLWNTRYADAALQHLRETGAVLLPEDVQRLSPLGFEHINLVGRYHFGLSDAVQRGALRPLRNPLDLDL
jgi:TnpA family transposase